MELNIARPTGIQVVGYLTYNNMDIYVGWTFFRNEQKW